MSRSVPDGVNPAALADPAKLAAAAAAKKGEPVPRSADSALVTALRMIVDELAKHEPHRQLTVTRAAQPRYDGPYTADELLDLAKRDTRFGVLLFAPGLQAATAEWAPSDVRQTMQQAIKAHPALSSLSRGRNAPQVGIPLLAYLGATGFLRSMMRTGLAQYTKAVTEVTNELQLHPLVVAGGLAALLDVRAHRVVPGASSESRGTPQLASMLTRLASHPVEGANALRSARALARKLGRGAAKHLVGISEFLRSVHGAARLYGLPMVRGHAQQPRPDHEAVLAFEVMGFEYQVADADAHGNPVEPVAVRHETASSSVGGYAAAEQAGALRHFSPAGRLWLCADGNSLYFSTDRRPERALFLVGEPSPKDAILHARSGAYAAAGPGSKPKHDPQAPLSGFVV